MRNLTKDNWGPINAHILFQSIDESTMKQISSVRIDSLHTKKQVSRAESHVNKLMSWETQGLENLMKSERLGDKKLIEKIELTQTITPTQ